MPLDEAALLLCEVEEFFPNRPSKRMVGGDDTGWGEVDDFATYRLDIGSTTEGVCVLCGGAADYPSGIHACVGRLEWSARICTACSACGYGIFDQCSKAGPGALLTPGIRAWVDRHPLSATIRKAA